MIHSHEKSWEMFNAISSTYDRINSVLSFGRHHIWRQSLTQHLPEGSHLDLLDLASGTGDQLLAFFEKKEALIQSAIGIDLSSQMLKIARLKIETKPYRSRIQLQCADALYLPFPAQSFNVASFSFGIRNVPDPSRSLEEIYRVLKPSGRCLILEFSLPPPPFKFFHLLYLRHILPRIGGFLSKHKTAYQYLNKTIETFPCGDAFCKLMKKSGFSYIQQIPMALGAVSLYKADKT